MAKVLGNNLKEGSDLNGCQTDAQYDQDDESEREFANLGGVPCPVPEHGQAAQCVKGADQEHIVGNLNVAGEELQPQSQRTEGDPGQV